MDKNCGKLAALLITLAPLAHASDLYLSASGPSGNGSGSSSANALDASSQTKFDAILAGHTANTVFHYAAGTYQTLGGKGIGPGIQHLGAGIDKTFIKLAPNSPGGDIFSSWSRSDNFQCQNITFDSNATGLSRWASGGLATSLNFQGSNVLINSCKFIHFGTSLKGTECFPVFCFPTIASFKGQSFTNVKVTNCVFTQPVKGNKDGCSVVYLGCQGGVNISDFAILNCTWTDCASDFLYLHAMNAPLCQGNTVSESGTNVSVGWYVEPGSYGANVSYPVTIQNNTFVGVRWPVLVTMHPNGQFGPISVLNNQIKMPNISGLGASAISVNGSIGLTPAIASLTISGNTFSGVGQSDSGSSYYAGLNLAQSGMANLIGSLTMKSNSYATYVPSGWEIAINKPSCPHLAVSANTYANGASVLVNYK